MKNKSLLVLSVGLLLPLTSCFTLNKDDKNVLVPPKEISTNEELSAFKSKSNILLTKDIECFAEEGFLEDINRREVEDATFDGQGHTFTIKGDKGHLMGDDYGNSLWYEFSNVTFKNLKIVYDYKYEHTGRLDFGGLVDHAYGCILDNVTIEYKRGCYVDNSERSIETLGDEMFAGGLVGYAKDTTINNCHVSGDIHFKSYTAGGIVGYLTGNKSCLSYSSYDGKFTHTAVGYLWKKHDNGFNSYSGALAGRTYDGADAYACEAAIDYIGIKRLDNGLRKEDFYYGLGFGSVCDRIRDIRIVLKQDMKFDYKYAANDYDIQNFGLLAGRATSDSSIKNVAIDVTKAQGLKKLNLTYINNFIASNSSGVIENIYQVGNYDKVGKKLYYSFETPYEKNVGRKLLLENYEIPDFNTAFFYTNYGYEGPLVCTKLEIFDSARYGDRLMFTDFELRKDAEGKDIYFSYDIDRSISCDYSYVYHIEYQPLREDLMSFALGIYGYNIMFEINKNINYVENQADMNFGESEFLFEESVDRWIINESGEKVIDFSHQIPLEHDK